MAEPTTIVTNAAIGAAAGAVAAPWISPLGPDWLSVGLVFLGGLVGAVMSAADVETHGSWWRTAAHVATYAALAVVLSGTLAKLAERYAGVPATEALIGIAWLVGLIGPRWRAIADFFGGLIRARAMAPKE